MVELEPIPRDTVAVLRKEAHDARYGSEIIRMPDIDFAELLEEAADEIERLRIALEAAKRARKV